MPANSSADDSLIGRIIGDRYRIISQLGVGGMGAAYRAWDGQGGLPVVVKVPKKAFLEDPKFAERFQREIRLLQGLEHSHIVPIVDVGEHDGVPFVVMRFLPGGSLSNRRLRDDKGQPRPNPPAMLHLWLPAVAAALDYIHAHGVVHRDVKPANIFFDAFWGAYLGDFGIAKVVSESDVFDKEHTLTATHMGIGTQEYMAPEQFTPKADVGGRADQYALGVMVYEMLAGERPFTGATAHLIVEVTTLAVPSLPVMRSDVSPMLNQAVRKALSKLPGDRFSTCSEFAAAVLRDVPPMADERGVARLLCPRCSNILKLPTTAAGQKGKCPKCRNQMKVADDLGALWLLDESERQRTAADGEAGAKSSAVAGGMTDAAESVEAFKTISTSSAVAVDTTTKPKRVSLRAIVAGVAAATALLAIGATWILSSERVGRQPPEMLTEKTLVAWVRLHNLTQRAGSALTIESVRDDFDAIVFGEAAPGRWYVGSNVSARSPANPGTFALEQEADRKTVCLAIVYRAAQVTMYRDGKVYESHAIASPFCFVRHNSRVLFGLRHTAAGDHACLAADIDDARIYDRALSDEEIADLRPNVVSGIRPVAWWNFNESAVRDAYGFFEQTTIRNCVVRDGRLILSGSDSYVTCRPRPAATKTLTTVFDFTRRGEAGRFFTQGPVRESSKGLEFPGDEFAWADSRQTFSFPLTVKFVAATVADKNFDCDPGIFVLQNDGMSFRHTGVHLHWGCFYNTRTLLYVFGKTVEIRHRPIEAGREYTITMRVDSERQLTILIDDEIIHQEVLPAHLKLEGAIRCSGGIGHVGFRSAAVVAN